MANRKVRKLCQECGTLPINGICKCPPSAIPAPGALTYKNAKCARCGKQLANGEGPECVSCVPIVEVTAAREVVYVPVECVTIPVQPVVQRVYDVTHRLPDHLPLPSHYTMPLPVPCPKCRRIRDDVLNQACVVSTTKEETAYLHCRCCNHRFKLPIRKV